MHSYYFNTKKEDEENVAYAFTIHKKNVHQVQYPLQITKCKLLVVVYFYATSHHRTITDTVLRKTAAATW